MKIIVLLVILALFATHTALNATDSGVENRGEHAIVAAPASFAGTWKTFVRCKPVDVILTQVGDKVSGTYSPGNGTIFDGIVDGIKLSFKWAQDGGVGGIGEFILNSDGKGFDGTSSQLKPKGYVIVWNTTDPAVTPFAGVWQTMVDGRNDVSLTMQQSGVQVTGQYPGNGRIEGTVSGKVLRFTWRSDRGSGSGRFVMEGRNQQFSGTYNHGANPDDVESTWSGRRPPGPESVAGCEQPLGIVYGDPGRPEGASGTLGKMSEAEYLKKVAEYEEAQKNAPATFAGVWQTKTGEKFLFPQLLFQQANDKVTGHLFAGNPTLGVFKEGIVDRNTLRFTVWRPQPPLAGRYPKPDIYLGTGELVMNADGKSFKGTILGAPTRGTLIAR